MRGNQLVSDITLLGETMKTNRAFLSAYMKGRAAFSTSGDAAINPYPDHRNHYRNGNTFSRAFRRFWLDGFRDAQAGNPIAYTAAPNQTTSADGIRHG